MDGKFASVIQIGLTEIVTLLSVFIAVTAWLIRLEAKNLANEKAVLSNNDEMKELRARHDGLSEKIGDSLTFIREALAEIRGRLSIKDDHERK